MIGYIKGTVLDKNNNQLVIAVHSSETGAVGYEITTPARYEYEQWLPGTTIESLIYTHVREDALDLFGFSTRSEKALFLLLLTVNGIGPKGALSLLSGIEPASLIDSILRKDKETLVQIPGVGKKTAERIVLELADALKKKIDAGQFTEFKTSHSSTTKLGTATPPAAITGIFAEAQSALIGLGYKEQDIALLLQQLAETNPQATRTEDLIRLALQRKRG